MNKLLFVLIPLIMIKVIESNAQYSEDLEVNLVNDLHKELNRHRLFNLSYNSSEQAELDRKAKHLEKLFGHDHRGLSQPFYGECIWYGRNYRDAITGFMNSKGHRKILKDLKAKSVCIGIYQGKESWFVVIRTYDYSGESPSTRPIPRLNKKIKP